MHSKIKTYSKTKAYSEMKCKKSVLNSACFILSSCFFLAFFSPLSLATTSTCLGTFTFDPNSIISSSEAVFTDEANDTSIKTPKFKSAQDEIDGILNHWGAKKLAPKALQNMLPQDIYYVNHRQNNSDEGVVKRTDGNWISLRYIPENALKGTNVGVLANSITDWMGSDKKYLVRQDSKAAIIWLHGGGTRTTGYQTGALLTNVLFKYDVDVISLSLPWHDEGPRYIFRDPEEFSTWMLEIIEKYIPADKPVIIAGHSMGGLLSDLIMRRSGDPNFKLGQRVAAYIPMAPVADLAPGQTKAEKSRLTQNFEENIEELYPKMSPTDVEIFEGMIRDGKMAHLTSLFIDFMTFGNNWSLPKDLGASLKPALVIVGKGDGLTYVGYEKLFDKYMKPLKNVEFKVIEPAIGRNGEMNHAGHVEILDKLAVTPEENKRSTTNFEVYDLILDFISRVIDDPLLKEHAHKAQAKDRESKGAVNSFLTLYSNHLAFRSFLDTRSDDVKKTTTQSFAHLVQLNKQLNLSAHDKKEIQSSLDQAHSSSIKELLHRLYINIKEVDSGAGGVAGGVEKNEREFIIPKIYPEDAREQELVTEELKRLQVEVKNTIHLVSNNLYVPHENSPLMKEILERSQLAGNKIPWDGERITTTIETTTELLQNYKQLQEEKKDFIQTRNDINQSLSSKLKQLTTQLNAWKKKYQDDPALVEQVLENKDKKYSDNYVELVQFIKHETGVFERLFEEELALRKKTEKWLLELDATSDPNKPFDTESVIQNSPKDLSADIEAFEVILANYLQVRKKLPVIIYKLIRKEAVQEAEGISGFYPDEIHELRQLFVEIYGMNSQLAIQKFDTNGLTGKLIKLSRDIMKLYKESEVLFQENTLLKKEYLEKIVFDFFTVPDESSKLSTLLETEQHIGEIPLGVINSRIKLTKSYMDANPPETVLKAVDILTVDDQSDTQ